MQVIGHAARVSLYAVGKIHDRSPQELDRFLGVSERVVFNRFVTRKRRVEFIGGRIAAKLACTCAVNLIDPGLSFACMDIPLSKSLGTVYLRGIPVADASISHSGGWAVALVSSTTRAAIDIEDSRWQRNDWTFMYECFSWQERKFIQDRDDAQAMWTIKECCAKLASDPAFELVDDTFVSRQGLDRWVGTTGKGLLTEEPELYLMRWGSLQVCLGFSGLNCSTHQDATEKRRQTCI